jgi:hypothetical protein
MSCPYWRGAPCGVPSLRRLAVAHMDSVAPVQVQDEDQFAVMEVCRQVIAGVLRRTAAEGRFIPRAVLMCPMGWR